MRRFLSLFTVLMLCGVFAFAQSRVVTGRVVDNTGKPVPFASVSLKGGKGVTTDVNGEYSLKVNTGDVIQISQTNYDVVDVTVGTSNTISTELALKTNTIKEVIVTSAFNTRRTARSTASNVQNVNSEQLNTVRQINVNDALAGKVAGIQVRSQSYSKLGAENIVRLRGENGLGIGGGALYVVDGTIVPNSSDINPDDIEDVTVLQGPAAGALFGADGANGAIVINTKKARRSQKNLGIEINSSIQFDKVYVLPDYQNSYAGGDPVISFGDQGTYMQKFEYVAGVHPAAWAVLDGKYYPDYQEDASWGPRMNGQEYIPWYAWYAGHERSYQTAKLTPQPNNARDFFNTGVTKLNNINFTKGGEGYNVRASYTNQNQTGIIPNSELKKHTFNLSTTFDLSNKFSIGVNATYISQRSNAENDDGYSNNTTGTFNNWFHRDLDMNILRELRGLKTPEGILATWNHSNPDAALYTTPTDFYKSYYWFSPFAWQDNVLNQNNKDRLYGDASLTYKPNNDLSLRFTYRKQQLTSDYETRQYKALETSAAGNNFAGFNYWEIVANRAAVWQGYAFGNGYSNRQNFEFLASYKKKIRDFALNANAGLDISKTRIQQFDWNSKGGLSVADEFLVSNSVNQPFEQNRLTKSGRRAVFVRADVGFRNYLFVEGTFRRDFSSTEAKDYSIDTKSVGLSFVFSDLLNKNRSSFLSFGKIRGSFGQILNTLGAYQNTVQYDPTNTYPVLWNSNIRFGTEPDRLVDPALHGAVNTEKEIGLELRFLKNRFGVTATYWDRTNKDFPFDVNSNPYIGYTRLSTNVGEVTKKGVDLQVFLNLVKTRNFDWMINATWGRLLENKVVSIAPGITRTTAISSGQGGSEATVGGGQAYLINEVGQSWGQLVGKGILRDKNGIAVLKDNGEYVLDTLLAHFGSSLPDYTGGFQSTFTVFKNFVINVNIDYSHGGKFFSTSTMYGNYSGLLAETATLNDKGNSVRDAVADGGGVHVSGVDQTTGKPVDYYIDARAYYHQFVDGDRIGETYIRDLTFVKMRELSLGYKLPTDRMGLGKYLSNATISVVARNPWLIYAKQKGFDPSEISTNYGEDAQLPGTRSIGVNLKVGF